MNKDNLELQFFEKYLEVGDIDPSLYVTYSVKNGLRNEDGTGVLVGLTKISDVIGYYREDGIKVNCEGQLMYRGVNVEEIITQSTMKNFIFEEISFLLLFGYLPSADEFDSFKRVMAERSELPNRFVQSEILRNPTRNLMNKLQKDVLTLYSYDDEVENMSNAHVLTQGLHLVAKLVSLSCYNYQSKIHNFDKKSMFLHHVDLNKSTAENILRLTRSSAEYTPKEAEVLDIALALHAEHGGGNNSTFVNVVMNSTGTDLYSSFAGAIGSLKGPKHGGANAKVCEMIKCVIDCVGYTHDEETIREIIVKILQKDFYDCSGLIYGMGHAVYTLSDPRSKILKQKAKELAIEKGVENQFIFYSIFEKVAIEEMYKHKHIVVCSNVDFYSGFLYRMLEIPEELYTLLFVIARGMGWLAHNIENNLYSGKIVRPATKYVGAYNAYVKMEDRK